MDEDLQIAQKSSSCMSKLAVALGPRLGKARWAACTGPANAGLYMDF